MKMSDFKIDPKEVEKLGPIVKTTYHTHALGVKYYRNYYKDGTCLTTIPEQPYPTK